MSQNQSLILLPLANKVQLAITAAVAIKTSGGRLGLLLPSSVGSANALTLNDANALVTAQTITGITAAAAAVVTISTGGSTNPFAVGNSIAFTSVGGMTQINTVAGVVTAIGGSTGAWTITTNINSTAFTAWTSGGTCASYGAANQIITLPYTAMTIGVPINFYDFPFNNGLIVSAVPGSGSPVFSISYN